MGLADLITRLSPSRRRADKAKAATADLKANAEKALRMKQDRKEPTTTPPHRTSSDGLHEPQRQDDQPRAREPDFTTQMGRSAGRRTGDGS